MNKLAGKIRFYDFKKTLGIEIISGSYVKHNFPRHTHRTLGIGVVEEGTRIISSRGERFKVTPHQVFIIPPNEAHSCESEGVAHTYRLFLISPDIIKMILPQNAKNNYKLKTVVFDNSKQFDQLMNLHTVLTSDETNFFKQSAAISTISDLVECCVDAGKGLRISHKQIDIVKRVQNLLEIHYDECFSLNDIAKFSYLSPYYLIHAFSQIIGVPPHIYQQQVRIRHAKEMLHQGIPIVEVANKTGFIDQSHFSKIFKKMVGITPGEYTKSILTL
ncbi:MAG: transcriptional regulator, AraC family [Firmicutes bacterium]|nr:transcriptional regulator, AraC family [Bacillota bacterium]